MSDEYDFNVAPGSFFHKRHGFKARSARKTSSADKVDSSIKSSVIRKLKSIEGNYKVPSIGAAKKAGNDAKALASTVKLDELKRNTVLKSGLASKPLGVSAEKIQQHCFPTPSWLIPSLTKTRFELYFEIGPDRLLDTATLRAYFLPRPNWYDEEVIRVDIKSFDIDTYVAIAAAVNACCYLPTAWTRLVAGSKWYIVLRPISKNEERLPTNTGKNLGFRLEAVRRKLPDKKWTWSFSEDSKTVDSKGNRVGGRTKSGLDPRQILLLPRMLPAAFYRLKPLPKAVIAESD